MEFNSLVKDRNKAFYIYDVKAMEKRLKDFRGAFNCNIKVHYAMKANNHPDVMKAFAKQNIGVDVVSGGELKEALAAGFKGPDIIFSGVGKTKDEILLAIEHNIKQINVESPQELQRIGELAQQQNTKASVAWRMNPDVNPDTHPYIRTGFRDNKFGMDESFLPTLKDIAHGFCENLNVVGLTMHIGSQIRDTDPFVEAIHKVKVIYDSLVHEGFPLKTLDIGGGLGIGYKEGEDDLELIKIYGNLVSQLFADFAGEVLCEPGRVLVGPFGWLLTQVEYIKRTPYKNFAIVNTGMHHIMRPMLYQAYHRIFPLKSGGESQKVYDIVGPICESADVLGHDRNLPELEQGDWLAIADAGAYGRVMASGYNSHDFPEEVIV